MQATVRTATTDHTHRRRRDSQPVTRVLVVVAAANRDPAVFDHPDEFRLDRSRARPAVVRIRRALLPRRSSRTTGSSRAAIPKILARQPVLAGPVHWRDTPAIRGPISVPLIFTTT